MRLIHCTQKLLKELKAAPGNVVPFDNRGLGDWYANLLRIDRRKCILFTNEKTLYFFLVPSVLKKDLADFPSLFVSNLCANLRYEGFGPEALESMKQEYADIELAKTGNRSVLGSMNESAFELKHHVQAVEGLDRADVLELNRRVNSRPRKQIGFRSPIEALEAALGFPPRKRPMPETPDEWLMEIAKAYCDGRDAKPFGVFVGTDIKDRDLYHLAPRICLKFRGLEDAGKNVEKATEAALASYIASRENVPALDAPHLGFAFCYLASHFGLGLLSQHAVNRIMGYVEKEADRLLNIIEYKCPEPAR